ncbi:hypothetical protein ABT304_17845 [Nocardioides sp. NPDC000445]|uniref:hypothetical protein n=1 Tax=Nocardioides sp. NPDC000445 TaxID=3154257 RepID=UPI003317F973
MTRPNKVLLGLLLFNGLSATAGGLALMTDWIPEQASWVRGTDFPSNYFPGVILMALVGGSSLIAAAALLKRSDGWQLASIVAGTIMGFWIVGEIASIRHFHLLQLLYFATGALVVTWTPAQQTEEASAEVEEPTSSSTARRQVRDGDANATE